MRRKPASLSAFTARLVRSKVFQEQVREEFIHPGFGEPPCPAGQEFCVRWVPCE